MTEYYLNETVVTFSGNIIQDSTINMLRLSDPDAALIISRGQMQEGDELASQIEQQMKKLEKQVKDLHYTPVVLIHLKYEKTGRTLDYSGSDGIRFGGACKPVAQILVVNQ